MGVVPSLIFITVLVMDTIAIGVIFTPRLKSKTVLVMDHISIRIKPSLISITVLGIDQIAIEVVFTNSFVVAHGVIFP
jgi:hypothetical protein